MTNINGKTYAMTAITPMKPWKTPILRLLFFVLGHVKPLQSNLINLSFIHFARWVIVKRNGFPRIEPAQPEESLSYDYLLFFSNFNGTWNQYIDAFADVLSGGLDAIWIWSEKFPRARPVTAFKRYISLVQFDTDCYYTAYPTATTNDVKAAHRVCAALEDFGRASGGMTPGEFSGAYVEFLTKVQKDLGATGIGPVGT
ncbi:conserved hypothetical protein [Candidatus Sulfopaludibacter sp. SbA3]|nr:conserved hypothetical protein [Candidatus Sulfopaludibacter sp. SbA3]